MKYTLYNINGTIYIIIHVHPQKGTMHINKKPPLDLTTITIPSEAANA